MKAIRVNFLDFTPNAGRCMKIIIMKSCSLQSEGKIEMHFSFTFTVVSFIIIKTVFLIIKRLDFSFLLLMPRFGVRRENLSQHRWWLTPIDATGKSQKAVVATSQWLRRFRNQNLSGDIWQTSAVGRYAILKKTKFLLITRNLAESARGNKINAGKC